MISESGNIRELVINIKGKSREEIISILQSEGQAAQSNKQKAYEQQIKPFLYLLIHKIKTNEGMPPHPNVYYWKQFAPVFHSLVEMGETFPPKIMGIISRAKTN